MRGTRLAAVVLWCAMVCAALMAVSGAALFAAEPAVQAAPPRADPVSRFLAINEVAWMGTQGNVAHEWIELYNPTTATLSLSGWTLSFADGSPSTIALTGTVAAEGYFLLESDDDAVMTVAADLVYAAGLHSMSDGGEQLVLRDDQSVVVDTANAVGGAWPAGVTGPLPATMERRDPTGPDTASNWCTNDGVTRVGQDAGGNLIMGTPRARNSCYREPSDPGSSLRHLPLVVRGYTPPRYAVLIEAVLYDGVQIGDLDEAVLLLNGTDADMDVSGWQLCKWGSTDWACASLPSLTLPPRSRAWLARSASDFARSFGFPPDAVLASWPQLNNGGDELVLRDTDGAVRDAVVFELGNASLAGWQGSAIWPYTGSGFAVEGQVLYRHLDERTGLPFDDCDNAVDWAQYPDDWLHGRRVRYAGWDLERFYHPAVASSGAITVGIAPDNAYQLVVDTVRSAERTLELEVYKLEHRELVDELVQRAQEGVTVTVLLEGAPAGGMPVQTLWACQQLHATGRGLCAAMVHSDTLRIDDRYTFLHSKMMIVDRARVLVGSQNFSATDLPGDDKANGTGGSRGVVIVTDAPSVVACAVEIFEADCDPAAHADISIWSNDNVHRFGLPPSGFVPQGGDDWTGYTVQFPTPISATGTWLELLTAPESALRTRDALLGLLARAGAGSAIHVEQLYEYADWGDPLTAPNPRLQAYLAAARRGARVRILLNGGTFATPGFPLTGNLTTAATVNTIARAEGLDLEVRLADPTRYGVHNKMILVDLGAGGQYAHMGSLNGSEASSKVNREVALQVRSAEVYNYLRAMFDYDWAHQPEWHVVISELLYRPADQINGYREWIEIYNPTSEDVSLSGWYLGDMTAPVGGLTTALNEGMYRFPPGATLPAGGVIVVAQQAADIVGFTPDYEFVTDRNRDLPAVPNMQRVDPGASSGSDGLRLVDTGDEVVLRDAGGVLVDGVAYGAGVLTGVTAHPGGVNAGHSLERRPPEWDSDDCARDFYDRHPPTPHTLSY